MKSCPALGLATLCALALPHPALHAADPVSPSARTVEFSAEARQSAANDLMQAVLYVERSGSDSAAVAAEINRSLAAALETAAGHGGVKTRSGAMSSAPVYAREGGVRIEGWRMRAEIQLESRDLGTLSALIGKLQTRLALDRVTLQPAPETRRQASDAATVAAIHRFEQRAGLIAGALGKTYRIQHLSLSDNLDQPVRSSRMLAAPAATGGAVPLEGGESLIEVTAHGRIELLD
jgi:predicted secreted protein